MTITTRKRELNNVVIRAIANSGVPNVIDKTKESIMPTRIKNENLSVFSMIFSIYFVIFSFLQLQIFEKVGSQLSLFL